MMLLQLVLDGALAAAGLLALLFVSPATAREPTTLDAPVAFERPVQLHRLATSVEVRLLGSLADVRVAQAFGAVSATTADLARQLPAVGQNVDGLRAVHGRHADELLPGGECGDVPTTGHVRLSEDERIADALRRAPGADAAIEALAAHPLVGHDRSYRVRLPAPVEADETLAMLIDCDEVFFLLLVPHRASRYARLLLRPRAGEAESVRLGAIDTRDAILVPLPTRADLDGLADGAIELELADGGETSWATLVAERVEKRPALHTRTSE